MVARTVIHVHHRAQTSLFSGLKRVGDGGCSGLPLAFWLGRGSVVFILVVGHDAVLPELYVVDWRRLGFILLLLLLLLRLWFLFRVG